MICLVLRIRMRNFFPDTELFVSELARLKEQIELKHLQNANCTRVTFKYRNIAQVSANLRPSDYEKSFFTHRPPARVC